tara:strand:- start:3252 stop:6221 length:2970 start_codon:yes stop_codon:yes gene_type:complete
MFVSQIYDEAVKILGKCDRSEVYRKLTQSVKFLMDSGWWYRTNDEIDVCTGWDGMTVTLPREISTPLAVNVDGSPCYFRGRLFQYHVNKGGMFAAVDWAWDDRGFQATMMELHQPSELVAVAEMKNDVGKRLRIVGWDSHRRTLRSQEENGDLVDGLLLKAHALTDFPGGIMIPDGLTIYSRDAVIVPLTDLVCASDLQLSVGTLMQISVVSGSIPDGVVDGGNYFIGVVNATTVRLYVERLSAEQRLNPIIMTAFVPGSVFRLSDLRTVRAITKIVSSTPHRLSSQAQATFAGTVVPTPLQPDTVYYVDPLSTTDLQIYRTAIDAELRVNPIYLSDAGSGLLLRARRDLAPVTNLSFTVDHNFSTGDSVTANNSGGSLPEPLIANVPYFVRSISVRSISLHTTFGDAISGDNAITLNTPGSGTSSLIKLIPASVTLGASSNVQANGHGLSLPVGGGASGTATLVAQSVTAISLTSGGAGYSAPPSVILTGGGGTGATATAQLSGSQVSGFTVISGGTNYTSPPAILIQSSGGSFVQFATSGSFPSPISQGTVYRAEAPITSNSFTLKATDFQSVAITSLGSGELLLVISRAFSIAFNSTWKSDLEGLVTGDAVYLATSIAFPLTSPQVDDSTIYYLRRLNPTTLELYSSSAQALNTSSTTGRIVILSLGSGDQFLVVERAASVAILDSLLDVEFTGFIEANTYVTFSTTGILPSPLGLLTPYRIAVIDNKLQVFTVSGVAVPITAVGNGAHQVRIERDVTPVPSPALQIPSSQFLTGDAVLTRDSGNGLPSPLTAGTYFARRIDQDVVALYATALQAADLTSTAGLVSFTSSEGPFQIDRATSPILVGRVDHVEKEISEGFISLYAWDRGRDNDMTLIGQYHPTDVNPKFRRIRIGKPCAWVRILYQVSAPRVTSEYDYLPIENERAILMALRAMDLEDKNFLPQADNFKKIAVQYLRDEQEANQGHAMEVPQINILTYGLADDPFIS